MVFRYSTRMFGAFAFLFSSAVIAADPPNKLPQQGWGTIKGRVVWGAELPKREKLSVVKDSDYCLKKGDLLDETFVVDPKTKGIKNVFAYIKKASAIHPDLPQTAADVKAKDDKDFEAANKVSFADLQNKIGSSLKPRDIKYRNIVDQVHCVYTPHALAVREGERMIFLNAEDIAHNVKISGISGKNDANKLMQPGTVSVNEWVAETQPLAIECNIHGWMNMRAMVFDHPYFAVTGDDGTFEIKNVPAGEVAFVLRQPKYIDPEKGGKGTAKGAKLTVPAGGTVDLGEVKYSGE